MKWPLGLLLVIVLVIILSGCSVTIDSRKSAESPTPTRPTAAQAFVQDVRNQMPEQTAGVPDNELLDTGNAACGALDRGVTLEQIQRETIAAGIDPYLAGGIVGNAIHDLCPEYEGVLSQYLDSLG
jgi:hypothetical protein